MGRIVGTALVAEPVEQSRAAESERLDAGADAIVAHSLQQRVDGDRVAGGRREHREILERQRRGVQVPPQPRGRDGVERAALDDLEGVERAGLEGGRDLDEQRHDAESRDREGDVVVAGEHMDVAVEVDDVHRDLCARVGQLLERAQGRGERASARGGTARQTAAGSLRATQRGQ